MNLIARSRKSSKGAQRLRLEAERLHLEPPLAHRLRRHVDDADGIEPLRMACRVADRVHAAHRHADEREVVEAEVLDELARVLQHQVVVVAVELVLRRPLSVAVAALFERHEVVPGAQQQAGHVPRVRRQRAAVQQHHRWQRLVPPVQVVEADAVELHPPIGRRHDLRRFQSGRPRRLCHLLRVVRRHRPLLPQSRRRRPRCAAG